jgi:CelD/BcsL family acetyltransferase involved in cellulose biosynthesis
MTAEAAKFHAWPAASVMTAVTLDPRTDPRWQALADRFPSDVFHSPAWMRVLSETYGLDVKAHVVVDSQGTPTGGLPFCHIHDLRGERLATLPFSDYCDPLVDSRDVWAALTAAHLAAGCPVAIRCVHNDLPLGDARFAVVNRARWHGLDLAPDLDALWRGFHASAHRAIRKSQHDGVVVRPAETMAELRAFYDMHLAIRKYKYRMLAQPYRFFENLWRHFLDGQRGFLLLAWYGGEIIAGVIFLRWKDTMYYKFNASAPADLTHRPNDQIVWEGIRRARDGGCTALDFGLSDWDQDGLIFYKRKFGTVEKTISYLHHSPRGSRDAGKDEMRELMSTLISLFVQPGVPDEVTERASEELYRYFS